MRMKLSTPSIMRELGAFHTDTGCMPLPDDCFLCKLEQHLRAFRRRELKLERDIFRMREILEKLDCLECGGTEYEHKKRCKFRSQGFIGGPR